MKERDYDYFLQPLSKRFAYRVKQFFVGFISIIWNLLKAIPLGIVKFFTGLGKIIKELAGILADGSVFTKLSFILMGLGNIARGQIIKGMLFLGIQAGYIIYMAKLGVQAIASLKTLGTVQQGWVFDEAKGIDVRTDGDNSMQLLLFGIMALFITFAFIIAWYGNVKSSYEVDKVKRAGKKPQSFMEDVTDFFDKKLYKTLLFLPITGIVVFTILPLAYMISIAFTNFDNTHQPPGNLFTWVGFENFKTMLGGGNLIGTTFWNLLGWTLTWAVVSTALNYILGMLLAILINSKSIKFKPLWRTIFVLSIAVPQFVSLLLMRNMLNDDGALNMLLMDMGLITEKIKFLSDPLLAKFVIIIVNLWVGIPYTMLITSGILMNIPEDQYEAARIDGASPIVTFFKITLPYMLFVTAPYLITQFIGNINNFNVIYFLTGGGPMNLEYYQAGSTDLLVTWLYKLTTTTKDYNYASTIGILVFVISAVFSLITYRRTKSYKNEEGYQ